MTSSASASPRAHQSRGAASTHRKTTARSALQRLDPVNPLEFVDPDHTDSAAEHRPHADRSAEAMRRLRTPFTAHLAEDPQSRQEPNDSGEGVRGLAA
ncbi:hypothetical protein FHX42_005110 [Saccharopolyspora lacisalsi]|uniref:Uncharacterized protein n=1 Tax=Halosaccharopolyspora lacisalsi TaxID=1000566 RepID=A0A839E723_9PSEU|nr:hypothetical protein [Halosaccharopolyspora lacisalsi]MBA8827705.1 hypothetical protein [Halosaccharopolyspora lacisalsi]